MPSPVATTLVTGRRAIDRETAIAASLAGALSCVSAPAPAAAVASALASAPASTPASALAPAPVHGPVAVILEGLADPHSPLTALLDAGTDAAASVQVHRIAAGCLCCAGDLVLRVTLNRLLRRPPAQLFISLADATHVGQLRAMLSAPPYDALLSLCDDVAAPVNAP